MSRSIFTKANFDKHNYNCALNNDSGKKFTYRDIANLTTELEQKLPDRSLVLLICSNCVESIAGYAALMLAKHVPILVEADISAKKIKNLVDLYQPDGIWAPLRSFTSDDQYSCSVQFEDYALLVKKNYNKNMMHDDLSLLLSTSGTTGSAKFVRLSYKNILANTQSIIEYLGINKSDRPITNLPMSYSYGLSIINTHLYSGAEIQVTDKSIVEKSFWEFFERNRVTTLSGVPNTFEVMKKMRFFNNDFPNLRMLTQAGGRMDPSTAEYCHSYCIKNSVKFFIMYGQTEASPRMSYNKLDNISPNYSSIGRAIPGGLLYLTDECGNIINEPNRIGELNYKGANVFMGYASSSGDLAHGDQHQGRLATGDLAFFNEDGLYFIAGRKSRITKINGVRINLDEVEAYLLQKFTNLAVVSGDNSMVIFTNKSRFYDIEKCLKSEFDIKARDIRFIHLDELPRSSSGKVIYSKLEIT